MTSYVDAHVHLYEFKTENVERFLEKGILLVAVAEDYNSSIRNLELRDTYPGKIKACIGLHPWNIKEEYTARNQLELLDGLSKEADCIGEVGLDLKFVPSTFKLQHKIFNELLGMALKYNLPLNLHAAGAWHEVFLSISSYGIRKALFHWYTGPLDLLKEIIGKGYLVSINAAISIQEKSRRVLEKTPLNAILTESDGPYKYRGLNLAPDLIPNLVSIISQVKCTTEEKIKDAVYTNLLNLLSRV